MKKFISIILAVVLMMVILTGCGSGLKEYAGTYLGESGGVLILNKDGTATCTWSNWRDIYDCSWRIEDGYIIVSDIKPLPYDIFAKIELSTTALLFDADAYGWDPELFVKEK